MKKAKPIIDRHIVADAPPYKSSVSQSKAIFDPRLVSKASPRPKTTGERGRVKPKEVLSKGRLEIALEANPIHRSR